MAFREWITLPLVRMTQLIPRAWASWPHGRYAGRRHIPALIDDPQCFAPVRTLRRPAGVSCPPGARCDMPKPGREATPPERQPYLGQTGERRGDGDELCWPSSPQTGGHTVPGWHGAQPLAPPHGPRPRCPLGRAPPGPRPAPRWRRRPWGRAPLGGPPLAVVRPQGGAPGPGAVPRRRWPSAASPRAPAPATFSQRRQGPYPLGGGTRGAVPRRARRLPARAAAAQGACGPPWPVVATWHWRPRGHGRRGGPGCLRPYRASGRVRPANAWGCAGLWAVAGLEGGLAPGAKPARQADQEHEANTRAARTPPGGAPLSPCTAGVQGLSIPHWEAIPIDAQALGWS